MRRWSDWRARYVPHARRLMAAGALAVVVAACAATLSPVGEPGGGRDDDALRVVRVALATHVASVNLSGSDAWRLYDGGGASVLVRGGRDDEWRIERQSTGRLRAVRGGESATGWRNGPLVLRPIARGTLVKSNGKKYRGEIRVLANADSGMLVVNHVPLEDYLLGVVPLEIGDRTSGEAAAVEAQAVAARSYVVVRLGGTSRRPYDLLSTVSDQVYGGADAERPVSTAAVTATRGLVLSYGGRTVSAPYFSTCGGSTAEAPEVWRTGGEPYLRRVSDRIADTDRYYCDPSPRFRWTRAFTGVELDAAIGRYLRTYASVPASGPGHVRALRVNARTPSGRVESLTVQTTRGEWAVRGNDARSVLRTPSGEILNSAYFSVESVTLGGDGLLRSIALRGQGSGHGVGMCQWGAIGRARAGQDFRSILQTYYPGTTIESMG